MATKNIQLFVSRRVVFCDSVNPAILLVSSGRIEKIISCNDDIEIGEELKKYPNVEYEDFGNLVLMPGIVDSHVHVNEPGRSHWEGFWTATKAAAAGGVTTIVDMPLIGKLNMLCDPIGGEHNYKIWPPRMYNNKTNSIPPTTTVENLKTKVLSAQSNTFVDVGFWGGVIPGNQADLKPLVEAGVVGFKCFLCPSGVDEFPHVDEDDVKKALLELQSSNTVLAFHAEREVEMISKQSNGDPSSYDTYLQTRPSLMEVEAIKMIINWSKVNNSRCHVVHLSASEALRLVKEAKEKHLPLTAETCYHYLYLTAEKVPPRATQFKCCPPIRDESNREKLWAGLKDGTLDMVVSDHSPCTADLKGTGDFLAAWGGISSLQFGLPLFWTQARARGLDVRATSRLLCREPARLCGLERRKGGLGVGMDADLVVWDPDGEVEIRESEIFHKNKLTPYLGEKLFGKVVATVIRGNFVYKEGNFSSEPLGKFLLKNDFLENSIDN